MQINPSYLLLLVFLLAGASTSAAEIDLTRHLAHYAKQDSDSVVTKDTFIGTNGEGRIYVDGATEGIQIVLNGATVVINSNPQPIDLQVNNELEVSLLGQPGMIASIRIKQTVDITLNVTSRIHFNTNVSDFFAARDFYHALGFETVTGFPDANTQAMARAIGVETPTEYDGSQGGEAGGYLLHGEIIGIDGFLGGVIDLIEFTIPRDESPPYPALNRLGMVKAAMQTTDIDADYEYMTGIGVEFISSPATRADGTRFAIFKDLDGTFYELIEVEGDSEKSGPTHINGLDHVTINVSDFERSVAWYQMLGYEFDQALPETDSSEVASAMGFAVPYRIKGARMTLPADGSAIEVVQWIDPFDASPPWPVPINHLGIHRIAFATTDIEADVAALEAQGVRMISPITPCCSGPDSSSSIVAFYDPDGTIVELAEQPLIMAWLIGLVTWVLSFF